MSPRGAVCSRNVSSEAGKWCGGRQAVCGGRCSARQAAVAGWQAGAGSGVQQAGAVAVAESGNHLYSTQRR